MRKRLQNISRNTMKNTLYLFLTIFLLAQNLVSDDFTDNKNGTLTDSRTNLIWMKCSLGQDINSQCSGDAAKYTWEEAFRECSNLRLLGKKWRLPSIEELFSLLKYNQLSPAIESGSFPNTQSGYYWTSTMYINLSNSAWIIDFGSGYVYNNGKTYLGYHARCVVDL